MDGLAAQLDAEQTKFLGGDLEHTHLVKGLDYALLRKMREAVAQENQKENDKDEESSFASNKKINPQAIRVETELGLRLKGLIFPKTADRRAACKQFFASTSYEFDLSEDAEQELPVLVSSLKSVSAP